MILKTLSVRLYSLDRADIGAAPAGIAKIGIDQISVPAALYGIFRTYKFALTALDTVALNLISHDLSPFIAENFLFSLCDFTIDVLTVF